VGGDVLLLYWQFYTQSMWYLCTEQDQAKERLEQGALQPCSITLGLLHPAIQAEWLIILPLQDDETHLGTEWALSPQSLQPPLISFIH
jgi:hypothetical protein